MLRFRDFVPEMLAQPRLFKAGEYESLDSAMEAANLWIAERKNKSHQLRMAQPVAR
jgi:hypothetical protein